jgi:hypothetical protein
MGKGLCNIVPPENKADVFIFALVEP